ncbi:MAG: hypothetical protein FJZ00_03455 [Candidatus Sericytochromatia bacterium]|uniref:Uncharacterized protein n=1 Tax=Candidatus Tanganyikabacteria bacterium TaxID=2961651 RepID=A0A937X2Q1_9BACT|nr:hypothetical protein [Candidatus Tanganyikabacteria bacterium]
MAVRGAVPAEINHLRERVERWRRSRRGLGPMPGELWAEAVAVARKHGLYATARGAGIDYGALAERMRSAPTAPSAGKSAAVQFVEWSGVEVLGQAAAPAGAVVEMRDGSGRQVTVRMSEGEAVDVAGIVAASCGTHR